MRLITVTKCLTIGLLASLFAACNPWDEHVKVNNSNLDASVIDVLKQQADLSTFVQVLEKTGYDSVIINAQSYTIFAPTNGAWTGIDLNNIEFALIANENDKNYGIRCTFTIISPFSTILNPEKWNYNCDIPG